MTESVAIIIAIMVLLSVILSCISIHISSDVKFTFANRKKEETPIASYMERIEYSLKFAKFLDESVTDMCVIMFKDFIDSKKEVGNINKRNVTDLVEVISKSVHDKINESNISYEYLLYDKSYYDNYIIQITIARLKKLLYDANIDIN